MVNRAVVKRITRLSKITTTKRRVITTKNTTSNIENKIKKVRDFFQWQYNVRRALFYSPSLDPIVSSYFNKKYFKIIQNILNPKKPKKTNKTNKNRTKKRRSLVNLANTSFRF